MLTQPAKPYKMCLLYFIETFIWKHNFQFEYPKPRRDDTVIEDHFGHQISDPYRWMEDPDAEETQKFVKAQNEISMPYIHQCGDRSKITEELTKLKNYPKFSVPSRHGDNYFTYLNSGLQNQSVLYKHKTLDAKPELFFDPNTLSSDGKDDLSSDEQGIRKSSFLEKLVLLTIFLSHFSDDEV